MGSGVGLPGSAGMALAAGVVQLDPERAVFEAMLSGWAAQQLSRRLAEPTIRRREWAVRRFAEFTNEYPWRWGPGDLEDFTAALRSGDRPRAASTIRGYHVELGLFLGFVSDPRYGWIGECEERFGSHPAQICTEWNTVRHVSGYEGDPRRRPLTGDELQALFDHADGQVARIAGLGRKGMLAAFRDATLLKVVYGWGLRRNEAVRLDVADLRASAAAPSFGGCAAVHVRWGKASRGSPPKRRTVHSVFGWAVEALTQYVDEVRPRFGFGSHPALWVTERGSRLSGRALDGRFAVWRDEIGLDPALDLHCLRHTYVTDLVEAGYPERFVTEQVGHAWGSTTAIYTSVSDDFKNRVLAKAVAGAFIRPQQGG
ncbi:MAG: tyrosine-type recombinase/integrase [Ilumatobacteraceae bacterium]